MAQAEVLGKRIGIPSSKMKENLELHQNLVDEFWNSVKDVHIVSGEDKERKIQAIKDCYNNLRSALKVIPSDIRVAADRALAILESSEPALSQHSSTSSRKAALKAQLEALDLEEKARMEESSYRTQLKRMEQEEAARRAQYEYELGRMKQELEDTKMKLDLERRRSLLEAKMREEEECGSLSSCSNSKKNLQDDKSKLSLKLQLQKDHDHSVASYSAPQNKSSAEVVESLAKSITDNLNVARTPAPEPSIFHGDPLAYPAWKASFSVLIDRKGIQPEEKIHYLNRYLKGEAKQAVEGLFYFGTAESYTEAMSILEDRFGNSFRIAEAFRDKITAWPKVRDSADLRRYSDFLRQCQMAMTSIKGLEILNDCRENRTMLQKLPDWLVVRWSHVVAEKPTYPDFRTFSEFIKKEADIACNPITNLETIREGRSSRTTKTFNRGSEKKTKKEVTSVNATSVKQSKQPKQPCLYCEKGGHNLHDCRKFIGLTAVQRREFILKKGRCFGCLGVGHRSKECRKKSVCETCSSKHPTCLHGDYNSLYPESVPPPEELKTVPKKESQYVTPSSTTVTHSITGAEVMTMMIVPVYLCHGEKEELVYALLDTQSDATFVLSDLGTSLGAPSSEVTLKLKTMNGTSMVQSLRFQDLQVRKPGHMQKINLPSAYGRDSIPSSLEHIPTKETASKWSHLKPLSAELLPRQDTKVGLLIGVNCPQALAPLNFVRGEPQEPYGVETALGWSIIGGANGTRIENQEATTHRIIVQEVPDELKLEGPNAVTFVCGKLQTKEVVPRDVLYALEEDVTNGIAQETVTPISQEDMQFLDVLEKETCRDEEGYYQMPLPFKNLKQPRMPNNEAVARRRLEYLRKKLQKNPQYHEDYLNFVQDIIDHKEAEEVPEEELDKDSVWYIPHHGVYHPKKPNKIRVVFDCSADYQGVSLNTHLLQGPDQMNNLVGILCRFRKHRVAFSCDIERMFHQFRVRPEDRDYLRFLWWRNGDINDKVVIYRMKVHLFGATSSPGCAIYGLKKTAQDNKADFIPEVVDFIEHDFYMDDGLKSVENAEDAIQIIEESRQICQRGNLHLHKFISNDRTVLEGIPLEERSKDIRNRDLTKDLPIERTLGLKWCLEHDQFQFKVVLKDQKVTRRSILSTVASIYDPLGLLAPFVLMGKRILQSICQEKLGWDDPVSERLASEWTKWRSELLKLHESVKVSRCYLPEEFGEVARVEVHHFCDASYQGYGHCSYLRFVGVDGNIHCTLVMGKSRVPPKKIMTIPRLELCGAVLSTQVARFLRAELKMNFEEVFWTDSKIVLGYIANESKRFHVFVANRVKKIKDASEIQQWHHVKTEDNPADHASRGLSVEELSTSTWFTGPEFLWAKDLPIEEQIETTLQEGDPEVRAVSVLATKVEMDATEQFSDWSRTKRILTICRKFAEKLKQKIQYRKSGKSPLAEGDTIYTIQDLQDTEKQLVGVTQKSAFSEEIKTIRAKKSVKRKSLLYKLDPFLDNEGLLRVGGRLSASEEEFDVKHPLILPKKHHVTNLIVKDCHESTYHQGRGMTLNETRARGFWIIGGSSCVSKHIYHCVICRKLRSPPTEQKMADLPKDRFEEAPPFSYCAVDYFGPFLIKQGRKEVKRYGCLFTCLTSRAVHVETADTLETDSFICALRRFIALRGPVRMLRSDRGTNFVGAESEMKRALKEMKTENVKEFLKTQNCDFVVFNMNVPSASHQGGIWERQIRTVRSVLSGILAKCGTQLSDESLRTFLYEVMAVINSRPLSVESLSDPTLMPLTPNLLLTMKSKVVLPPPGVFDKEDLYSRKHWRRVQSMTNQFWDRWHKEYLQNLQSRSKWNMLRREVSKEDIVLVKEENLPRCHWKLARVSDVYHDIDGHVRKVRLTLPGNQFLERPIQKLIVLLSKEEQNSDTC